jgi:hypothetical protein
MYAISTILDDREQLGDARLADDVVRAAAKGYFLVA